MHILFVVPYAPNLIRTRPYNLIRHLAGRGHQLTVLTLYGSADELSSLAALREDGITVIAEPLPRHRAFANSLAALPTPDPLQSAYCWQPALAQRLEEHLTPANGQARVDVVHVEHLRGARYALHANMVLNGKHQRSKAAPPVPVIWDSVDCISHLFRQAADRSASRFGRWVTRLELPRTERYEGWLAWQFDKVLTTSPVDRAALADLALRYRPGTPPIELLPNGVDLAYFQPDQAVEREPATLLLSGKMSYHANITMAVHLVREVMPLVWAKRPDATVTIVGKDPSPEVRALADHPAVTVTGTVPDLRPYMLRATVAVAPITYGAGIQNKVLEAMACATPVVATTQAVSALVTVEGRDLLTGDDPERFAQAILRLLEDKKLRDHLSAAGHKYVSSYHDWSAVAGRLEAQYTEAQDAVKKHAAAVPMSDSQRPIGSPAAAVPPS